MSEHHQPVDLPGLPPLTRITFTDEQGEPLPDVKYSLRPQAVPQSIASRLPRRAWVGLVVSVTATVLAMLLTAVGFLAL